jgi:hypothetical protein
MWLLVADFVRRGYRWPALAAVFGSGLFWWIVDPGGVELEFAFVASTGVTLIVGPLMTFANMAGAVRYLPVSRRDVWRATWIASAGIATCATLLVKLPVLLLGLRQANALAAIALSSLYDFAAAGAAFTLMSLLHRPVNPDRPFLIRLTAGLAAAAVMTTVVALTTALQTGIPTAWAELTPGSGALLIAMLGIAVAGLVAGPGPIPGKPRQVPRSTSRRAASPNGARTLTGLPRLLLHEFAWSLTMGAGFAVTLGLIAYVIRIFSGDGPLGLTDFLRLQMLLLFDGTPVTARPIAIGGAQVWYAFFAASISARFLDIVRHLRSLPIRTAHLVALFLAWPAAMWLAIWTALAALNLIVSGSIHDLRPYLLFQAISFAAAAQAVTLWVPIRYRAVLRGTPVAFLPLLPLWTAPPSASLLWFALAMLAAAVVMTRAAFGRTCTYAAVPNPQLQPQL